MIELDRVSRAFGGKPAVSGVTLTIRKGEMVAIVGPSGSGKTTLLRMINRLLEPDAGVIRLNGTNTATIQPHLLRRRIGYAIQDHGLFPHRTVAQNVATVPRLLGWNRAEITARTDELLALFGLEPSIFRDRYPHQLSGGQQQRVGVARALAARPEVLLMDEPFGALDPLIRAQARRDLRAVQTELGTTTLIVTHDMDEALSLGDRVAVMDQGRLLQFAPPAELLVHPAQDLIRALVGEGDRPFHLLALRRVAEVMERGEAGGPAIPASATLRDALAACLWSGREALPVAGQPMRVTLAAIRGAASGTTP